MRASLLALCVAATCAAAPPQALEHPFTASPHRAHGPSVPNGDVILRLRREADAGSADAQYQLALLYLYGQGVAQDNAVAARYFKDAAGRGHAQASGNLGAMFAEGRGGGGGGPDPVAAFSHYKRAGEAGEPEGLFRAALLLYDDRVQGYDEHERLADAHDLFTRARGSGHPQAVFYLAVMREYGLHLPQSFVEAGRLYAECCDPPGGGDEGVRLVAGDPDCCYHAGLLHAYGRGVSQDFSAALALFRTCMRVASEGGGVSASPTLHGPCGLYLGLMAGAGQGMPVDYDAARVYLQQAAESGDPRAVQPATTAFANLDRLMGESEAGTRAVLEGLARAHADVPEGGAEL